LHRLSVGPTYGSCDHFGKTDEGLIIETMQILGPVEKDTAMRTLETLIDMSYFIAFSSTNKREGSPMVTPDMAKSRKLQN